MIVSTDFTACQKSSTPSKATHTTQHNLSTNENMIPDTSSKSNYKSAKTSFMAMKGKCRKIRFNRCNTIIKDKSISVSYLFITYS